MLSLFDSRDELLLLNTSLALDASVSENLLQLFDSQLGDILRLHLFSLDWELYRANFRVALVDALTNLERSHAQRERLGNISLDGVDVVANLAFTSIAGIFLAVVAHGSLDGRLLAGIFLGEGTADVVHDLDADLRTSGGVRMIP